MANNTKEARAKKFGPSVWVGPNEAAAIRGCSTWKIFQEIRKGILPSVLIGGSRKILRSDAEKSPNDESSTPPTAA